MVTDILSIKGRIVDPWDLPESTNNIPELKFHLIFAVYPVNEEGEDQSEWSLNPV